MARIRSIHPGFFTDEDLVATSMPARLLFLGLGIEADDKGIFEWKPLTIKMRVFPADSVDIAELLSELEAVNAIRSYEIEGRRYGAIRNFRKFQKPKTPNDIHPMPDDFRSYTGLRSSIEESSDAQLVSFHPNGEKHIPEVHSFPQNGEKSFQMEDGGGKRDSVSDETAEINLSKSLFDQGVALLVSKGRTEPSARAVLAKFQQQFGNPAVLDAIERSRNATEPISAMRSILGKAKSHQEYLGV